MCLGMIFLFLQRPFKHESLLVDSEEERMTEVEKYFAMKSFQQDLKLIRSNPSNQQSGQGSGYRPQPAGQTGLPRPQTSQVRTQGRLQTRLQTGQTGQASPIQQVSRPFPQIPGLQVPIPPVPETASSTSGMMERGSMSAAPIVKDPNKNVEIICLDSDDDDSGDDRPVALTRGGEIPIVPAANDPISLSSRTQLPTHSHVPGGDNDPLPTSSVSAGAGCSLL